MIITMVTAVAPAPGRSPRHVPSRGNPSCALAATAAASSKPTSTLRICPLPIRTLSYYGLKVAPIAGVLLSLSALQPDKVAAHANDARHRLERPGRNHSGGIAACRES